MPTGTQDTANRKMAATSVSMRRRPVAR